MIPDWKDRHSFGVLTDLQNTGARFADADRSILLDWGRLPHLVRVGEAKVELKLQCQLPIADNSFRVFALDTAGNRRAEVPCSYDPETSSLHFSASTRQPFGGCLYYEIVRERTGTDPTERLSGRNRAK